MNLRRALELLSSWWRVDRIRVAPSEGELLRLEPPAIVTVDGEDVEIVSRSVEGATVRYRGVRSCGTTLSLTVTLDPATFEVRAIHDGQEVEVAVWGTVT